MRSERPLTGTALWSAEGHPVKIEYSVPVLGEIRAAAESAFYRFPRGGVEIGGILFGTYDGEVVRITAARPVACEYLHGPSYVLSEKDEELFGRTLHAPAADPLLAGLQPVGWYHSHTRSGIFLSEQDLKIHERHFPKLWQLALVVRPEPFGTTRGGFFVREPDSTMRAESSCREFELPAAAAAPPSPPPAPPRPTAAPFVPPPRPGVRAPFPKREPPPARARRGSVLKWAVTAAAALVMIAAAATVVREYWKPVAPPRGLSLRVLDAGSELEIDWDPGAPAVRRARSASLEIVDGGEKLSLPFDALTLRTGRFTYVRHSSNVEVRLKVQPADGKPAEEFVRFLGKPDEARTAEPVAELPPPSLAESPRAPETVSPEPARPSEPPRRPLAPTRTFNLAQLQRKPSPAPAREALPAPPLLAGAPRIAGVQSPAGLQPPPPPPKPQPVAAKPAYSGPPSGRVIWTGRIATGAALSIDGQNASAGFLNGQLPGVPVRITVQPAELTSRGLTVFTADPSRANAREAAGQQNGWNPTAYEWEPRRAGAVAVIEQPAARNHWRKLVLRAGSDAVSVIIIDWSIVPGEQN